MSDKNITTADKTDKQTLSREETRAPERYTVPVVDILEGNDGLAMYIDMPGVPRENMTINLEQGILTIEGKVQAAAPAEEIYREFSLANFYRQFRIPEGIDQEKVSAAYADGVLALTLPRAEAAKPRRIEISAGG